MPTALNEQDVLHSILMIPDCSNPVTPFLCAPTILTDLIFTRLQYDLQYSDQSTH
jgi:hypothetical protein